MLLLRHVLRNVEEDYLLEIWVQLRLVMSISTGIEGRPSVHTDCS